MMLLSASHGRDLSLLSLCESNDVTPQVDQDRLAYSGKAWILSESIRLPQASAQPLLSMSAVKWSSRLGLKDKAKVPPSSS